MITKQNPLNTVAMASVIPYTRGQWVRNVCNVKLIVTGKLISTSVRQPGILSLAITLLRHT